MTMRRAQGVAAGVVMEVRTMMALVHETAEGLHNAGLPIRRFLEQPRRQAKGPRRNP